LAVEGRQSTTIVAINEEAYGVELNRATIKHEESKMSHKKCLLKKRIQQARRVGKDASVVIPKNCKNEKLIALAK
jgi:hypothetical protein